MSAATGSDPMTPPRRAAETLERRAAGTGAVETSPRPAAEPTPTRPVDDAVDGWIAAFEPAVTRRILEHRGSTTALLGELSGAPVSLRLLEQRIVGRLLVPDAVSSALHTTSEHAEMILRRSALLDAGARLLSLNRTVAPAGLPAAVAAALTSAQVPIGIGLSALGRVERRDFLARGRTRWPGRAEGRCAFREYVIRLDGLPVLFVHEAFNPAVFPVGEVPVGPTPAFTTQSDSASLVLGAVDGRSV